MTQRTTVMVDEKLMERVKEHTDKMGVTLSAFYTKALVNQLEREGDFEVRDMIEEEKNDA